MVLPAGDKRLLLQALWWLGWMRFGLLVRSFKSLVADTQLQAAVDALPAPGEASWETVQAIGWAVQTAAGVTPWESACLVQVLAAKRMLQRLGIGGALFLGAVKGSGESARPSLRAHAWLKCGEDFVTGEEGHERFGVVSVFSWAGSPS
jgi:hypothetical protein